VAKQGLNAKWQWRCVSYDLEQASEKGAYRACAKQAIEKNEAQENFSTATTSQQALTSMPTKLAA